MLKRFEGVGRRIFESLPDIIGGIVSLEDQWTTNPPPEEGHIDGEGKFKAGKKPQNPLKEGV